jgi:hypothetical protein
MLKHLTCLRRPIDAMPQSATQAIQSFRHASKMRSPLFFHK